MSSGTVGKATHRPLITCRSNPTTLYFASEPNLPTVSSRSFRESPQPGRPLPQRRRGVQLLLLTALLVLTTRPATAQNLVERTFEEDRWNAPPSEVAQVGEDLGLVDLRALDLSRTRLEQHGYAGRGLRIEVPQGGFRGFGPLDRLEPARNEVWYRYHIRLVDWNAAFTGKLPGLAGLYSSSARGCIPPTPSSPGWSARGLFGPPGTQGAPPGEVPIGTYLYHADQEGTCGDNLWWGASLEQGRWHCVEGKVKMNTPGANNGEIRGWLDGELVLGRNDIQYRSAGESHIGVRHMWHNVYFGGSWSSPNPLSLQYDQIVVSTSGRIGCLAAFTDIGETVHVKGITELHALGKLYGCDHRRACPERELSRGEIAAFFGRIVGLPQTSRDYFDDDGDSVFQSAINRLAAAGITEGCGTKAFCPDRTVTRAQFAVMLSRAIELPQATTDAFRDDNGHWAERAIDKLATTGITAGCASDRFCPEDILTRAEAATFFLRVLDYLQPHGLAGVEPPPDYPPAGDPPPIPVEERD